jgi:hypothetical protein
MRAPDYGTLDRALFWLADRRRRKLNAAANADHKRAVTTFNDALHKPDATPLQIAEAWVELHRAAAVEAARLVATPGIRLGPSFDRALDDAVELVDVLPKLPRAELQRRHGQPSAHRRGQSLRPSRNTPRG